MKVLFVCHGNINRSAAGEIILKQMEPTWEVKSAALKETKGGEITAKKMRDSLNQKGYITTGIRSTKMSEELADWADVIFYMDDSNFKKLEFSYLKYLKKCYRISDLIGEKKIPDPNFAQGNLLHLEVISMLERALVYFRQNIHKILNCYGL